MDNLTVAVYRGDEEKVDKLIEDKPENAIIKVHQKSLGTKGLLAFGGRYYSGLKKGKYELHMRTFDMSLKMGMIGVVKCLAECSNWKNWTRSKCLKGDQRRFIEQNQMLYDAASYGKTDIVKFLIDLGAEVDVSRALYAAAGHNHVECLEFLINLGANIEVEEFRERDQTALERAVETNSVDAAKLLIQKGANIKKVDKKQRSLLMRSAEQGLCDMIKFLLKAGADANAYKHVCARSVGSSPCNLYKQEN